MPLYAIGDVQGCLASLQALLEKIHFNPEQDQLWLVGDLVNRGPDSLGVLRFVKQLGDRAITVLGNHDLHLLAVAHGLRADKHHDLTAILHAEDSDELLHWLRHRPLLHHDIDSGFTLIHAGLPPQWDLATAQQCAQELETVLRDDNYTQFLAQMYGDQPDQWSADLHGMDRLRFICNCFTRLRYCERDGRLALNHKGPPGTQAPSQRPWFDMPDRRSKDCAIVFGHWSTLGAYHAPGIFAIDTGCVWGGALTALQLDGQPPRRHSVECPRAKKPGIYY
jgi:bis(5'-nucleosyl)-tetraphosphatase (symmetrical)